MKKLFFILFCLCASPVLAGNRTTRGLSVPAQLGITSGTALACNAGSKLDDFELIASRIIANSAPTEEAEQAGYREFAQAKLRAYQEQRNDPQETCSAVLDSFRHLPIFRSIVYADGSVRMYDGSYLKPQRPVQQKKNTQKQDQNQKKKK